MLRDFVDTESRNYSGERFNRFVAELHSRIKTLIQRCAALCCALSPSLSGAGGGALGSCREGESRGACAWSSLRLFTRALIT